MTDPNPTDLIRQGRAAARVGRLDEARDALRRAVELNPDDADAWLALAGVEEEPAAKIACFENVLRLDPDHTEARLSLEMLRRQEPKPKAAADAATSIAAPADDELEAVIAEASRRLEEAVGPPPPGEVPPDDVEVLYCANHPTVETRLRCNRCGKPICTRCAVQTPVGYRCKECIGQQQAVFYTGGPLDYAIGGAIALVLGGVAAYLMVLLRSWFIALILGPTLGMGIAEAVRFAVRRRRSRYLWAVVAGGLLIGALPALFIGLFSPWALIALGIFLALAVGAATARLR
ncbi:MAG TPA: tetratricopeptide repeat protein [Anaerolineae bacterium]|nr:tetratricopeptide repeat protein [Anaerolineae bacterium]